MRREKRGAANSGYREYETDNAPAPARTLFSWPGFAENKAAVLAAIEDQRTASPNSVLGVGTGWSGPKTLFDDPRCAPLRDWIAEQLPPEGPWEISAWGNVMGVGDSVRPHDHLRSHLGGENTWAGVFFLGDQEPGGARLSLDGVAVDADAGTLVIFTATTMHSVDEHRGVYPRATIGFNVRRRPE